MLLSGNSDIRAIDAVDISPVSWHRRQAALLFFSAAALFLVFEYTSLDRFVSRFFYHPASATFPWRHSWFLENIMHTGWRRGTVFAVLLAMSVCLLGMVGKVGGLPRRSALAAFIGMPMIPLVINGLKIVTRRHCPWDLLEFGGFLPFSTLFETMANASGRCFPSGHASTGFLWLVWVIALRPRSTSAARAALIVGVLLGSVQGFIRILQGAHFLSHILWSLWFSWAICLMLSCCLNLERN